MTWFYNDKEFTAEDIPDRAIGFLYIITHLPTGNKYVGRKLLTKASTKTVNGKKKKIRKPSDWENYWSSSPTIIEMIKNANGDTSDFKREILCFAYSKSSLTYMEECYQYTLGVLENDGWINSNIRSKQYRKNIFGKEDVMKFREILSRGLLAQNFAASSQRFGKKQRRLLEKTQKPK